MEQIQIIVASAGRGRLSYSAWEPIQLTDSYWTVREIGGDRFGKVGTRRIPEEIDALPVYSMHRIEAVEDWYASQRERAFRAIVAAHSEAARGRRCSHGEIELEVDPGFDPNPDLISPPMVKNVEDVTCG